MLTVAEPGSLAFIALTGIDTLGTSVNATTTTNVSGFYEFSNLAAGTYTVTEAQPSSYLNGKDTAGSTGGAVSNDKISTVTPGSGESNTTLDAGVYTGAALGNKVWVAVDKDGVQDAGELGVAGLTVKLLNADGSVAASQTTAGNGNCLFSALQPGSFALEVGTLCVAKPAFWQAP